MRNKRKSIRLPKWDYSSGVYFLTICSFKRDCIFGDIKNGQMILNEYGEIVHDHINKLDKRFDIDLISQQIMPNHLHFVMKIVGTPVPVVGAHHDAPINPNAYNSPHKPVEQRKRAIHESPLQKRSKLSLIIGYLKMNTSKRIHQISPNQPVWQRNYYEHIIRNENELMKISKYIENNPINWHLDKNNPDNFLL